MVPVLSAVWSKPDGKLLVLVDGPVPGFRLHCPGLN